MSLKRLKKLHPKVNFKKLELAGYDVHYPLFMMEYRDLEEEGYVEFGNRLLDWVENTSQCNIENFCYEWLISPKEFLILVQKNTYLEECYRIALAKLLTRRTDLVNSKKMPSNVFIATLPQYSPEFREFLIEKESSKESQRNDVLAPVPTSDLVPEIVKGS